MRRRTSSAMTMCGALIVLLAACSSPVTSPSPQLASFVPVISPGDARLLPVLADIEAHPAWADGDAGRLSVALALPSFPELCVEVARPSAAPLHVMVDVGRTPWQVAAVAVFEPGTGARVTHERTDVEGNGMLCTSVLLGSPDPFPSSASSIEVNGPMQDDAQRRVIQEALLTSPAEFGIESTGRPAINVMRLEGSPSDLACFEGVVYLGGPRAKVMVGLSRASGSWQLVSVRILEQALLEPQPRSPDGC